MLHINTCFVCKIVNKAFWVIAVYVYVVVPIYCFVVYGYLPNTIGQVKALLETKNMLLDVVKLISI